MQKPKLATAKPKRIPTEQELYEKLAARCARAEYSAKDIFQKVVRQGLPPETAHHIVDRLTDEGFLNEERYARAFVHDKFLFDHWGRRKILAALKQKGISGAIVDEQLSQIDEKEYRQTLKTLLIARNSQIQEPDDSKRFQKLLAFAAGRGFELDLAYSALEEIINSRGGF